MRPEGSGCTEPLSATTVLPYQNGQNHAERDDSTSDRTMHRSQQRSADTIEFDRETATHGLPGERRATRADTQLTRDHVH